MIRVPHLSGLCGGSPAALLPSPTTCAPSTLAGRGAAGALPTIGSRHGAGTTTARGARVSPGAGPRSARDAARDRRGPSGRPSSCDRGASRVQHDAGEPPHRGAGELTRGPAHPAQPRGRWRPRGRMALAGTRRRATLTSGSGGRAAGPPAGRRGSVGTVGRMGAALRGTASKKRHGRGWRRQRDRGSATWSGRKATSTRYCRGPGVGTAETTPMRPRPPAPS